MTKRPDSIEPVMFSPELLRQISRSHKLFSAELQKQLLAAGYDGDIRTIQRQLKTFSAHFPIELDGKNKPSG